MAGRQLLAEALRITQNGLPSTLHTRDFGAQGAAKSLVCRVDGRPFWVIRNACASDCLPAIFSAISGTAKRSCARVPKPLYRPHKSARPATYPPGVHTLKAGAATSSFSVPHRRCHLCDKDVSG